MARKRLKRKGKAGKNQWNPAMENNCTMWSELPAELLEMIVKRLDLVSYVRFGAVCVSWLAASRTIHSRPADKLPWLMLSEKQGSRTRDFFNLSDGKVYCLELSEAQGKSCFGSSNGWLIVLYQGLKVCLLNPFTKEQIRLPRLPWGWRLFKAVLSSVPTNSEAVVMAIAAGGEGQRTTLAFCRPSDRTWTFCYHQEGTDLIEDVIFFQGKFHAINSVGVVIVCDVGPCRKVTLRDFGEPSGLLDDAMKIYLVESCGDLLQVINYEGTCDLCPLGPPRTTGFQVFRLDLHESKWVRVECLSDRNIFLGTSTSMSLSAATCPEPACGGNRIYFTDDNYEGQQVNSRHGCYNSGIFNLAGRYVGSFFATRTQCTLSPPIWITPNPW